VGVINKLLFRGGFLSKPRHRNLFLDMEENIHIHYRDLRVELGRAEFEEFAKIFKVQSAELLGIIWEKRYEDGKLPNANQDDVRIFTESRLKKPVKYHPQRVSIEACSDGYHLHYRNYKILIDEADFRGLIEAFRALEPDAPDAATHREVLELLVGNDIDCLRSPRDAEPNLLGLLSAPHHTRKIRNVLENIGFTRPDPKYRRYFKENLEVVVETLAERPPAGYGMWSGQPRMGSLVSRLLEIDPARDQAELNYLKCQVVDAYLGLRKKTLHNIDTDFKNWMYDRARAKVIFPSLSHGEKAKFSTEDMYRKWAVFLRDNELSFIKPHKRLYSEEDQKRLMEALASQLAELGKQTFVHRVYLMGSANRKELGVYDVPFMHGKWAKLGSDFDLLIEVVPGREGEVSKRWKFHHHSETNDCGVYHIGHLPMLEANPYPEAFPNIDFYHHLLDAYVYFPSRSDEALKDAFLEKFKGQVVWEWRGEDDEKVREQVGKMERLLGDDYGLVDFIVEAWRVSTMNAIYRVLGKEQHYVLKQFLVAGNYHQSQVAEHAHYEAALIEAVIERGITTAAVVPLVSGEKVAMLDGKPVLLFDWLAGERLKRPEYPLERVAEAIAQYHLRQVENPITLETDFSFNQTWEIWRDTFKRYHGSDDFPETLSSRLESLASMLEETDKAYQDLCASNPLPALHCHGDLAPKNIMVQKDGRACLFDFNNAFYGSRLFDLVDTAYEFALAEKYVKLIDFGRFKQIIDHYCVLAPLNEAEKRMLPLVVRLFGLLKFTKEVRGYEEVGGSTMRTARALAIARFLEG